MKIVYNWLKEFVDVTAPPADLRARLSLAGIAIDSIEEIAAGPVLDAEITANRPDCLGHLRHGARSRGDLSTAAQAAASEAEGIRGKSSRRRRAWKSNRRIFAGDTRRAFCAA